MYHQINSDKKISPVSLGDAGRQNSSPTRPRSPAKRPASTRSLGVVSGKKISPSVGEVGRQGSGLGKRPTTGDKKTGVMMLLKIPSDRMNCSSSNNNSSSNNILLGVGTGGGASVIDSNITGTSNSQILKSEFSVTDDPSRDNSTGNDYSRENVCKTKSHSNKEQVKKKEPNRFAGLSSNQRACLRHLFACIIMCFKKKRRVTGECGRAEY